MRRSSWSRRSIIVGSASLLLLVGTRASAQPTRPRPKVGFLIPTAPDDVDVRRLLTQTTGRQYSEQLRTPTRPCNPFAAVAGDEEPPQAARRAMGSRARRSCRAWLRGWADRHAGGPL